MPAGMPLLEMINELYILEMLCKDIGRHKHIMSVPQMTISQLIAQCQAEGLRIAPKLWQDICGALPPITDCIAGAGAWWAKQTEDHDLIAYVASDRMQDGLVS